MKIKVKDIAKAAGVSPATVSLVLNDRPSRIADSTKERILRIATEMRFEQDSGMDFSSLRNTRTLGMIIPDTGNPFYHRLAEEVSSCAFENGYVTLQCFVRDDMLCFYQALESLIAKTVDGLVLIPPKTMDKENVKAMKAVQKSGPPVVLLDRAAYNFFCDFVTADHKAGARIATDYLITCGHTRIGCMVGGPNVYTSRTRVNGYCEALAAAKIPYDDSLVYYGNYDVETGRLGLEELLKKDITAVVAGNDLMAYGIYLYAQEHHLSIPEDLSVIGYDNTPLCGLLGVPLTSIEQDGGVIARKAVEVLLERISFEKGPEPVPYQNYYFTPHIVERKSVKNLVDIDK